jgi:predicted TIM-barrel fold metal-dependent hydrolase
VRAGRLLRKVRVGAKRGLGSHFEPLIRAFPQTKVVIDHLGRPFQGSPEEYAVVLGWARLPNTVMKLSSRPAKEQ